LTWGFVVIGSRLLWLRGDGEGDRAIDQVEGAALVWGGVGAGEGGQVVERPAEAAERGAVGGALCRRSFSPCARLLNLCERIRRIISGVKRLIRW
jgi:hypothetical protein